MQRTVSAATNRYQLMRKSIAPSLQDPMDLYTRHEVWAGVDFGVEATAGWLGDEAAWVGEHGVLAEELDVAELAALSSACLTDVVAACSTVDFS